MERFADITKQYLYIFTLLFLLILGGTLYAQENEPGENVFWLDFRASSSSVDTFYLANAQQLAAIDSFAHKIATSEDMRITSVTVRGTASPDGNFHVNRKLAKERLELIEGYLRSNMYIPDTAIHTSDGVAWAELAEMVRDSDWGYSDKVVSIVEGKGMLVNVTLGYQTDSRVLALMKIAHGKAWKEMEERFFPRLRMAKVTITTDFAPKVVQKTEAVATNKKEKIKEEVVVIREPRLPRQTSEQRRLVTRYRPFLYEMDFKTNGIGWGLGMINGAVEVDLCRYLTLHVPVYYSAYNYFVSTIKFRTFMVQPELRGYFRPNNEGWFVGAHFGMGYYNIAVNGDYRIQDHAGESPALGGGLAVGYRMPLTKTGNLKMEFSLGAGGYKVHYDRFYNQQDGLMVNGGSVQKVYWGLDQANVSIIYSLGLEKKDKRQKTQDEGQRTKDKEQEADK